LNPSPSFFLLEGNLGSLSLPRLSLSSPTALPKPATFLPAYLTPETAPLAVAARIPPNSAGAPGFGVQGFFVHFA
jgi:hypothetical protein